MDLCTCYPYIYRQVLVGEISPQPILENMIIVELDHETPRIGVTITEMKCNHHLDKLHPKYGAKKKSTRFLQLQENLPTLKERMWRLVTPKIAEIAYLPAASSWSIWHESSKGSRIGSNRPTWQKAHQRSINKNPSNLKSFPPWKPTISPENR